MKLKKALHIFVIALAAFVGIWNQKMISNAYTENEVGTEADIGTIERKSGGYSHVGVKVYWENKLICYALDTWRKTSDYPTDQDWNYVASNYNGTIHYFTEDYSPTDTPIWLKQSAVGKRFFLKNNAIRNGKTEYSVVMSKMGYGKETEKKFEIANVPAGEFGTVSLGDASFQTSVEETGLSQRFALGESYVYQIYDVRNIQPGAEIPANTNGGKLESSGKAYYNGSSYVITKLPTASYVKAGYTCTFEGWYNAASGGKQYKVGDTVYKGNTLYAHWKVTPQSYNVTCIDVLGKHAGGKILGKKSWQALCDESVSGEKAGTDKAVGAYYSHCYYTGASKATVTVNGATVYRYFSYENMPVQYIDQVECGKQKGELLHTTTQEKPYLSKVSGADLGDDTTPGAYYKGYVYSNCSSGTVEQKDGIIYRYFKPVIGSISFDKQGVSEGTMPDVEACEYGERVLLPKNAYKKTSVVTLYHDKEKKVADTTDTIEVAHKFLGWSDKPDGTLQYTDGDSLDYLSETGGELKLYPIWSTETVTLPNVSSRIGYRFLGWSVSAEEKSGLTQISVRDSVELYAVWKPDVVKYHVELYKEKVDGGYEMTSNYEFESYADEMVSLDSAQDAYPGFTLDEASSKLNGRVKSDGSLILCAYYRRNSYALQYDLNGGKLTNGSGEIPKEKILFGKNITVSKNALERSGYSFEGWSQHAEGDSKIYQPGDSFIMTNHDVTLYAQWKPSAVKVSYNNNAAYSKMSGISGTVSSTTYQCGKDSFASKDVFQAQDAVQTSWNTKPDGSGITVAPGANMRGLFDENKEIVLYAIWQYQIGSAVSFQVDIFKEGAQENADRIKLDSLLLQGKAGEKIKDALTRIYQKELNGESIIYFYKGYEVINANELEQIIALDSGTAVTLHVKERNCSLSFAIDGIEENNRLADEKTNYQGSVKLPDKLPNGEKIDRLVDSTGKIYEPGTNIKLEKNLQLTIQQAICLYDERATEKEQIVYVKYGGDFTFPKKAVGGFQFLGWYLKDGQKAADAGQIQKNVKKRCEYYAKWSEPLVYTITYDLEGTGVKILENGVTQYQHTKEVILPTKEQLAVPEGYRFVGWYHSDDITKKTVTKITAQDYGDMHFKAELQKENENETSKPSPTPDNNIEKDKEPEATKQPDNLRQQDTTVTQPGENGDKKQTPNDGSKKNDTDTKTVTQKDSLKKGDTFWQGNLKYKIVSITSKRKEVSIVANRWKKSSLTILAKVKYKGVVFQITDVGKKAFYGNKTVKKIIIKDTVNKLGQQAFSKMRSLQTVTIGKSITCIDKKAFYQDKQLKKIVVKSKKISKVGKKAFQRIGKKAQFRVPIQKKRQYKKMFRK